jgi:hypothetical protein
MDKNSILNFIQFQFKNIFFVEIIAFYLTINFSERTMRYDFLVLNDEMKIFKLL